MSHSAKEILEQLKSRGFRLTSARTNLVEFILKQKGHWTIQDLAARVRAKYPEVGVATIYRTVGLFADMDLLSETRFTDGVARYEVAPQHHHDHLKCNQCGQIFEFENDEIEKLQQEVAKKLGFKLTNHRMELYGECQRPRCKWKTKRL